jgi:uncharacterized protein HemX
MWAAIAAWVSANRTRIIEGVIILVGALSILFAIWLGAHERMSLAQQVGSLEEAQKTSAATIEQQRHEIARLNALNAQQAADIQTVLVNVQALNDRLSSIRTETEKRIVVINKHDLGKIGAKKPKLLEKHINRATTDVFGRLRDLTK